MMANTVSIMHTNCIAMAGKKLKDTVASFVPFTLTFLFLYFACSFTIVGIYFYNINNIYFYAQ